MPLRTLERRFDRFRRTGDPAALAQVFDATAPEVLRVAHHLTRDASAAEDLLQRTFVTAIERAPTWDASRRLLPWLLGILANHAKEAARHAARPLDARRLPANGPAAPAEVAERRELAGAAERAIDALADPARSVLVLRYRHGLEPAEIALALGMAPATVRSHLHRGVERVRRAVPGSLAGAVLAGAPPRGLAAVRAEVLAEAAAATWTPVAVASATGLAAAAGGALMGKQWLGAAAMVLLLAGGGAWVATRTADDGTEARSTPPAPAMIGAEPDASLAARPRPADGPATPAEGTRAPRDTADAAERGTLDVRVTLPDGTPLVDEPVALLPGGDTSKDWTPFARTGRDGHVRFERLTAMRTLVRGGRGGGKYVDVVAGKVTPVELVIAKGATVEGVVVDGAGAPVAGAEIWFDREDSRSFHLVRLAVTDAEGRFRVQHVHPDGSVSARARGRAPSAARAIQVSKDQVDRVRLVLGDAGAVVRGTVRGADGQPVADAIVLVGTAFGVQATLPDGAWGTDPAPTLARTDEGGAFIMDAVPPRATFVTVRARGHAGYRATHSFEVGENALEIRLSPSAVVAGRVVDPEGRPAAGAVVESTNAPRQDSTWWWMVRTDTDGRFRIEDLPGADQRPFYSPTQFKVSHEKGSAAFQRHRGVETIEVTLVPHREGTVLVRVVDEEGRPVEGQEVVAGPPDDLNPPKRGRTDAEGRVSLALPEGATVSVALTDLEGDLRQWFGEVRDVRAGPDEVTITRRESDRPSSRLEGRVTLDAGTLPDGAVVWAMPIGGRMGLNLTLDTATGAISSMRLLPGGYDVALRAVGYGTVPLGRVRLKRGETADLGTIRLRAPGRLVVKVRNTALDGSTGSVLAYGDRGSVWPRPADDGTFVFELLQPGAWDVVLQGWPHATPAKAAVTARSVVVSGETVTVEITTQRGHVRVLRPVAGDAAALAGLSFEVRLDGATVPLATASFLASPQDRPPTAEIALAPGRYVVDAETADGRRVSVRFSVEGDDEPPVDIDLSR
jgi:RNA polymerase sigma factor (sigma-70 family)